MDVMGGRRKTVEQREKRISHKQPLTFRYLSHCVSPRTDAALQLPDSHPSREPHGHPAAFSERPLQSPKIARGGTAPKG